MLCRKMIKSKKGAVLYYLVMFGFIIALVYYFVVSLYAVPAQQGGGRFPGEFQLEFLEEAAKTEGKRHFVEQAARISAHEAAMDLASLGGFVSLNLECGFLVDYNYWNNGSEFCWPDYERNFKTRFGNNFLENVNFTDMGYDFFVLNSTAAGAADDVLVEEIYFREKKIGEYAFRPSFEVETDYDLGEFKIVVEQAKELVLGCADEGEECVDQKISEFNSESSLEWQKGDCAGTLTEIDGKWLFCVRGSVLRVFDGEGFVDRPVEYKFGLDLGNKL